MTARIGGKTGGRRRGSLDKGERQILTAEYAADLHAVYKKLGGVKWLLKFAEDNPAEFLRQGLSRLFPAAPKDDEVGATFNTQVNVSTMGQFEQARRVAFMLAKAVDDFPAVADILPQTYKPSPEPEEYINPNPWRPPTDAPEMPEPVDDPARDRWASEIPLTAEQRRDNAAVRETVEGDITTYRGGSSAEQGGRGAVQRQQSPAPNRTVSEMRRRQLLS